MTDELRIISAHYDHEADALYVALEQVARVDYTIDAWPVLLDCREDETLEVVGIEVLSPTRPLRLAQLAADHGFAHLLDDIYAVAATAMGVSVSGSMKLTVSEAWGPVRNG